MLLAIDIFFLSKFVYGFVTGCLCSLGKVGGVYQNQPRLDPTTIVPSRIKINYLNLYNLLTSIKAVPRDGGTRGKCKAPPPPNSNISTKSPK